MRPQAQGQHLQVHAPGVAVPPGSSATTPLQSSSGGALHCKRGQRAIPFTSVPTQELWKDIKETKTSGLQDYASQRKSPRERVGRRRQRAQNQEGTVFHEAELDGPLCGARGSGNGWRRYILRLQAAYLFHFDIIISKDFLAPKAFGPGKREKTHTN